MPRVARLFGAYRWQLALLPFLVVAQAILAVSSPFLLRAILDRALPARDIGLLSALAASSGTCRKTSIGFFTRSRTGELLSGVLRPVGSSGRGRSGLAGARPGYGARREPRRRGTGR